MTTIGSSDLDVSRLCLGGNVFGWTIDEDASFEVLDAYVAAGGNFIDTADSYFWRKPGNSGGESETIIGNWMAARGNRDDVVIATKVSSLPSKPGLSAANIAEAAEDCLRRLRTDYLDLWYVHTVDDTVPFEETLGALDHAVTSGRVRYAGVSNYCGWRIGRAATWQQAGPGRAPIVANQVRYSLVDRGIEREVVPACTELGVGIFPWSPLGGGVLTGKYRGGIPSDSRAATGHRPDLVAGDSAAGVVEAVATAAEGLATSPVAVALAWLRDRPGVSAPILGARTLGQLTGALASETLELPREILAALDDVSAPPVGYPEDVH
ncbi:MAG: aldo/keto reductase [Microbacterium sp.]|uniref:aldo/keto reductase n=1 Tax=Microbacterium sp. TaxID=51671 RepID=UPI001AC761B5|nr:aldo/keto reductase [Microbacterium sp.]MBN9174657.1 aldo/keto reductase [Microbacterium sp.]